MSKPNSNNTGTNTRVKLSYSSMSTLQSCEQKYTYYKVRETPKDSDHVESDALGLGKAFHQVLERTLHLGMNDALITEAMEEHKVDPSEKMLLVVMIRKYLEFRKASGYKVIKCELPLETSEYRGFIDFIAVRGNEFFIGDLKTAGRHDENILSRLPLDPQLNLYAHFADELYIAIPELAGRVFGGCLYNQTIKSKAVTNKGLENGVKVIEMLIPASYLNPEAVWSLFNDVHNRAIELHAGEVPKKNLAACFNYFKPCEYFSQCYGKTFTENKNKIIVTTLDSINDDIDFL